MVAHNFIIYRLPFGARSYPIAMATAPALHKGLTMKLDTSRLKVKLILRVLHKAAQLSCTSKKI